MKVNDGISTNRNHKDSIRALSPFPVTDINMQTAQEAYESVLEKAGCSYVRDAVDLRIIQDVRNRSYTAQGSNGSTNGIIDTQEDVGGWPTLATGTAPTCTAKDGIPDAWKTEKGLPVGENVANRYDLSEIYTNLEVYMNSLTNE
jgi:hypothetical protein